MMCPVTSPSGALCPTACALVDFCISGDHGPLLQVHKDLGSVLDNSVSLLIVLLGAAANWQSHLVWSSTGAISLAGWPHISVAATTKLMWGRLFQTLPEAVCRELDATGSQAEVLPMTFKVSCSVASLLTFSCDQHTDLIGPQLPQPHPRTRPSDLEGRLHTQILSAGELDLTQFQDGPTEGAHAPTVNQLHCQ